MVATVPVAAVAVLQTSVARGPTVKRALPVEPVVVASLYPRLSAAVAPAALVVPLAAPAVQGEVLSSFQPAVRSLSPVPSTPVAAVGKAVSATMVAAVVVAPAACWSWIPLRWC
jgi:hypothetical protein